MMMLKYMLFAGVKFFRIIVAWWMFRSYPLILSRCRIMAAFWGGFSTPILTWLSVISKTNEEPTSYFMHAYWGS
jgi:hypothetical protein